METSTVFVVVALIAVAYFQQQRMQPADAQIMVFYSGYIVVSALLGYYFARWYVVPDTSWFETISVPIVITLIALLAACLLLLILEAISGRVSDPYASFLGMMLLATKVLVIIGPISAVIGIGVSIALHFRARAARCVEPNKTIEPTR
jgi:ACR3 family arsenite efflux pump ArsB